MDIEKFLKRGKDKVTGEKKLVDIECIHEGWVAAADVMNSYGTPIVRKNRPVESKHIAQMRLSEIKEIEVIVPDGAEGQDQAGRVHINDYPRHLEILKNARVLIVDDSRSVQAVLKQRFTEAGLNVVGVAGSGPEAIQMARTLKPTLVTMDLSMPDMDGITAMRPIIASVPGVKVVVISALGYQDRIVQSLEAGALQFFTKPLDYEKLKKQIIEILIK